MQVATRSSEAHFLAYCPFLWSADCRQSGRPASEQSTRKESCQCMFRQHCRKRFLAKSAEFEPCLFVVSHTPMGSKVTRHSSDASSKLLHSVVQGMYPASHLTSNLILGHLVFYSLGDMIHDKTNFACTSHHLAHAGIPCDQSVKQMCNFNNNGNFSIYFAVKCHQYALTC